MFMPERWLRSNKTTTTTSIHPFALLPFGFGNRMCAGRRFSELELYLATAKVVLNYRLQSVNSSTSSSRGSSSGSDNLTTDDDSCDGNDEVLERTHAFIVIPANPIQVKCISRS